MSNPLCVRRVKVQTIDEHGNPEGYPSFGIMAADDYKLSYKDTFESLEALNNAINEHGCILRVIDNWETIFVGVDVTKIGTANYYGKDCWNGNNKEEDFRDRDYRDGVD